MSHFIILTRRLDSNIPASTYRIRADRIDWMVQCYPTDTEGFHTRIGVNGTELHVEEPVHVILDYIKDPDAPLQAEGQYERNPNHAEYIEKYGEEEGKRRYFETLHYPARHFVPKK